VRLEENREKKSKRSHKRVPVLGGKRMNSETERSEQGEKGSTKEIGRCMKKEGPPLLKGECKKPSLNKKEKSRGAPLFKERVLSL